MVDIGLVVEGVLSATVVAGLAVAGVYATVVAGVIVTGSVYTIDVDGLAVVGVVSATIVTRLAVVVAQAVEGLTAVSAQDVVVAASAVVLWTQLLEKNNGCAVVVSVGGR
jgi:hypothetical protein